MRRSRLIPLAVVSAAAALAACSADAGDFASHAEKLIDEDDDGDLANQLDGVDFDGTACADPVDTKKGTTFTCTSTGSDGREWVFTATITGGSDYQITDAQFADAATDTAASTAPAGTETATTAATDTSEVGSTTATSADSTPVATTAA